MKTNGSYSHEQELRLDQLEQEIRSLKALLLKTNKFIHYPDWISRAQVFEICPWIKSKPTLKKHVEHGFIETRQIAKNGELAYSKGDCLTFAERYEAFYREKLIEPSEGSES